MRDLVCAILERAVRDWKNGGDKEELLTFFNSEYCQRMFEYVQINYYVAMSAIGLLESGCEEALRGGDYRKAGFKLQPMA